jgi:hypothetical protein
MIDRLVAMIRAHRGDPPGEATAQASGAVEATLKELWRDIIYCNERISDLQGALLGFKAMAETALHDEDILALVPVALQLKDNTDLVLQCEAVTADMHRELREFQSICQEVRIAIGQAVSNALAK